MNSNHTPAPWTYINNPLEGFKLYHEGRLLMGCKYDLSPAEVNARLIAAAPDMFKALDALIGVCQSDLETHFCDEIGGLIRSSYSKAKGGAA